MTQIRLHNTRVRRKQDFTPLDPNKVRMYVCGPTVYDRAHLGNARPVIVFDVLFRLLRHVYGADHVTYVRNFTDVDDKINDEAQRRKGLGDPRSLEELIRERTDETINWYHADMDALGALRPTIEPRATEFIPQMVTMIAGLIASGHAYEKAGHVLFRVRSYQGYGKLSGRSVDDMIAGARVEVAPFKEDPMDFVLWKPSTDDLPGWPSPWGRGRPGWHIECSAMSHELLGETFDIHGGGIDLQFPHHENEIAQSMCAHPKADFARYWMHNEMLQVEGKKMSKSLGNFLVLRDVGIEAFDQDGKRLTEVPVTLRDGMSLKVASRMAIRLYLMETHYRKPLNWKNSGFLAAQARLKKFRDAAWKGRNENGAVDARVILAIADDVNTPLALSICDDLCKGERYADLIETMNFLGLSQFDFQREPTSSSGAKDSYLLDHESHEVREAKLLAPLAESLSNLRAAAIRANDFSSVDALKSALISAGVEVRMSKNDVKLFPGPNFDPAKLEALK